MKEGVVDKQTTSDGPGKSVKNRNATCKIRMLFIVHQLIGDVRTKALYGADISLRVVLHMLLRASMESTLE